MRTRVYIDGYNLYYGCLKRTSHKWLDLLALFENHILPSISVPGATSKSELLGNPAIKFFTAPILTQAAKSEDSIQCQERYHAALRAHQPERVQVVCGYYSLTEARARAIDPLAKKWPRYCPDVEVWKLEEKQSDVNLALHAFREAVMGEVDHLVIVTNDTDIEPALAMIREHTGATIGLVIPTTGAREANTSLAKYAHWVRKRIGEDELRASQLPRVVQRERRSVAKPDSWYAHPDILERALSLGTARLGSRSKAFAWLGKANPNYGGQTPIDQIEAGNGDAVIRFMESQARAVADPQAAELKTSSAAG